MDEKELRKNALAFELRDLLGQWHALEINTQATHRDYARIAEQIRAICRQLDSLDGVAR